MTETTTGTRLAAITPNLYAYADTCNVYLVRHGSAAVLIDFGSGGILAELPGLGITTVLAVLMTHFHRDQGQGLPLAVAAGLPVWVPHAEQDLFAAVDAHWQAREVYNNYNMRQDRFALLEPVPIAGTLRDYARYRFGAEQEMAFTVVPTPGHTTGSIALLTEVDGQRVAFTGDLIAAPGKVWSLAATQWSYNGAEGVAASIPSLLDIKDRAPAWLLPSHGQPIAEPGPAIDLLVERLRQLLQARRQNPRLFLFIQHPYVALTPHLLRNRTSLAYSYVLLSDSGRALVIDYGYDFMTGSASGSDRASRRPWMYSLPALKREFGVKSIDVALPTHFHDDHVAGLNLLRDVEGTQVWAPESFAGILAHPERYDLPCLWYDPIPVDRVVPVSEPIQWEEHTLTLYPLPGHTLHAVAIFFEVDGRRVLVAGDQYQGETGDEWNYVYQNRFRLGDYPASAALYRRLQPDLILTGHWEPQWVTPELYQRLDQRGEDLDRLHRELLPLESIDFGAEGFGARLEPYQARVAGGEPLELSVEVRNPYPRSAEASVRLVVPAGWRVAEASQSVQLEALSSQAVRFHVTPPAGEQQRRTRVAADLTVDGRHFGQQAEALVTVVAPANGR